MEISIKVQLHRHAHRDLTGALAIALDQNCDDAGLTVAGRIDGQELSTGFANDAGDGASAVARNANNRRLDGTGPQISLRRGEAGHSGCKRRDD